MSLPLRHHWLLLSALVLAGSVVAVSAGHLLPFLRSVMQTGGKVRWGIARPEDEGLDRAVLDRLSRTLEIGGAETFLIARGGRLVHEWYAPDWSAERRHYTAAQAKGVVASPLVLAALSEKRLGMDDPGWKYVPSWKEDPARSQILVRHILEHASGLENVEFTEGEAGKLLGWQAAYYEQPETRFRAAVEDVPVAFTPGSRYAYSGAGYYALAYILGRAFSGARERDFRTILRERVMRPLGIPDDAWEMSYHTSYEVDGMRLQAVGSGAGFTARALAKMGQLFLDRGWQDGRRIFSAADMRSLLTPRQRPAHVPEQSADPVPAGGWWTNAARTWASLPRDAFAAVGRGGQLLLVVPSLDLVVVRGGHGMNSQNCFLDCPFERELFEPLMKSVTEPSSRSR